MIRFVSLTVFICMFYVASVSFAKDVHIQCGDLDRTYIVVHNAPSGVRSDEQYSVLFAAKKEKQKPIIDALNENFIINMEFDAYVNGKFAQHFEAAPAGGPLTPLPYSPVVLLIEVGSSLSKAVSLAGSYCPSTVPEGDAMYILSSPLTAGDNQ